MKPNASTIQLIEDQRGILGPILWLKRICLVHQQGMSNLPSHLWMIDFIFYLSGPVMCGLISVQFWGKNIRIG